MSVTALRFGNGLEAVIGLSMEGGSNRPYPIKKNHFRRSERLGVIEIDHDEFSGRLSRKAWRKVQKKTRLSISTEPGFYFEIRCSRLIVRDQPVWTSFVVVVLVHVIIVTRGALRSNYP